MLVTRPDRFPGGKMRSNIPRETMGLRKHGTINATPIGTRSIFCVVIAKQMAGKYNHTNAEMGNARIYCDSVALGSDSKLE